MLLQKRHLTPTERQQQIMMISSFLSNRSQQVVINEQSSEWTDVSSGVPQGGSVLGPLLFILYVNDLPDEVKSYCKLFADDVKLYKDLYKDQH